MWFPCVIYIAYIMREAFWCPGAPAPGSVFWFFKIWKYSGKIWKKLDTNIRKCRTLVKNFDRKYQFFCSVQKGQISDKKHTFLDLSFCQKFVFFTQSKKIGILCRNFTRVFDTCICFYPIFFQIFLKRFHIFQISKTKPSAGAPRHQNAILIKWRLF